MNFKIYKNKGKYYIYNVYGKCVACCPDKKTAKLRKESLEKDFVFEPANDNSILNSSIAKATRVLLGKEKE